MVRDEDNDVVGDEGESDADVASERVADEGQPEASADAAAATSADEVDPTASEEGGTDDDEEEYDLVEVEFDENDVVRYLEDEQGSRVGFVLLEDGEEVEYYYVDDDDDAGDDKGADDESGLGITRDGVAQATEDVNAIYRDGVAVAAELRDAFADIKSAFDFSAFTKK